VSQNNPDLSHPLIPILSPGLEAVSQFVIPAKSRETGREPWFDRLTTLSKLEGKSRSL
jgi:hypothetical protein